MSDYDEVLIEDLCAYIKEHGWEIIGSWYNGDVVCVKVKIRITENEWQKDND